MKLLPNKVDRMVSPITSPTITNASLYGTLSRCSRSRNRSRVNLSPQNDFNCTSCNSWRLSQRPSSTTPEKKEDEMGQEVNRITLWKQNSTVEQPEPQRFGSLGRHEDRLIRKYLQRHSSMGSRSFLPETSGDGYFNYGGR